MLCKGTDAFLGDGCSAWGGCCNRDGCSARPPCHAAEVRVSSHVGACGAAMLGCCPSANATSSPHVQAEKPALSLPWASQHPSEPGTSVQGGERPLTHPPHCESAAGLGQEPQPDILPSLCSLGHAPSRMDPVLPGQKWAGKRVWEEGTEPQQQLRMAGAGTAAHHPVLPQELVGRKGRVGWGLLCQSLPRPLLS